jgi:hypothetical protein
MFLKRGTPLERVGNRTAANPANKSNKKESLPPKVKAAK